MTLEITGGEVKFQNDKSKEEKQALIHNTLLLPILLTFQFVQHQSYYLKDRHIQDFSIQTDGIYLRYSCLTEAHFSD